jgi:hypothetical protein
MAFHRQGLLGDFDIFDVFTAVPVDYFESQTIQRIYFVLQQDDEYSETCPRLAASVNYTTHVIDIYAYLTGQHPEEGDSLFNVQLDDAKWEDVVERIGTFEHNKNTLTQAQVNAALENRKATVPKNVEGVIKSFLGGHRKTRRSKKNRKQTRRRKN